MESTQQSLMMIYDHTSLCLDIFYMTLILFYENKSSLKHELPFTTNSHLNTISAFYGSHSSQLTQTRVNETERSLLFCAVGS